MMLAVRNMIIAKPRAAMPSVARAITLPGPPSVHKSLFAFGAKRSGRIGETVFDSISYRIGAIRIGCQEPDLGHLPAFGKRPRMVEILVVAKRKTGGEKRNI